MLAARQLIRHATRGVPRYASTSVRSATTSAADTREHPGFTVTGDAHGSSSWRFSRRIEFADAAKAPIDLHVSRIGASADATADMEQWIGEVASRHAPEMPFFPSCELVAYDKTYMFRFEPPASLSLGHRLGIDLVTETDHPKVNFAVSSTALAKAAAVHEVGHALFSKNGGRLAGVDDASWATTEITPLGIAYHELAADAVAAEHLQNKACNEDSLKFLAKLFEPLSVFRRPIVGDPSVRSFDNQISAKGYKTWSPLIPPHDVFGPVRGLIGAKYPELIQSKAGIQSLLGTLAKDLVAISKDDTRFRRVFGKPTRHNLFGYRIDKLNAHVAEVLATSYGDRDAT